MILVDVYVAAVDKEYNFSLNENISVRTIEDEIIEMIEQKEQTTLAGNREQMTLCDRKGARVLPREYTLRECGIMTGSSMLLV